jgi:RNA polymerase subunit RPABC4/transcription elongation factor Spt4
MELTCSRCQQTVKGDDCFCPYCGLPQLVYAADGPAAQGQPETWTGAPRDASQVDWKLALRSVLAFAIPAGLFCAIPVGFGFLGLLLVAAASAWVVAVYMRSRRPAWITIGAGARIGLVTGIVGSWTAAAVTGAMLFAMRFWLHQGSVFDNFWQSVTRQMTQDWTSMGVDAPTMAMLKGILVSPEGRAGWVLGAIAFLMLALLVSATAGGAVSAHLLARSRRPEN